VAEARRNRHARPKGTRRCGVGMEELGTGMVLDAYLYQIDGA
jgi:hypothetical protein